MVRQILALLGSIGPYIIAFVLALVATFAWLHTTYLKPVELDPPRYVSFEVSKGSTIRQIAADLEVQNIIRSQQSILAIDWLNRKVKNVSNVIRQGEYSLSGSLTPRQIYSTLVKGEVVFHDFTIPEGATVKEALAKIEQSQLVTKEELQRAAYDPELRMKLGVRADTLEGYIFPSTYRFSRPITAEDIISEIVQVGKKQVAEKIPNAVERTLDLQKTNHEILTLASIVEKETADVTERARIASVFYNRLRLGMPLQSDPTVIYGIPNFNGNITKEDLRTPSPYNTYVVSGLPPTPICNPGIEAIRATLFPETSDYLYFVAKGGGSHQFSNTYKEHQAAVRQYQLQGAGAGE